MLRSGPSILKRTVVAAGMDLIPLESAVCIQQARGLRPRKPRYSGPAKTKLFRLPVHPVYPDDEVKETRRLHNQHKLLIRSICHYFKLENESHAAGSKQAEREIEAEQAEWEECLQKIEQWNKEIAAERNERLLKERKEKEELILKTIQEDEAQKLQRLKEIEELVKREKELSKTYITSENLGKAIEEALENKQDFNWALDRRGKKYSGRFVNAAGVEDLPASEHTEEEQLPPLFQSSPITSQSRK